MATTREPTIRLVLVLDIKRHDQQPETDRPGLRRSGERNVIDTHGELVRESIELRRVG